MRRLSVLSQARHVVVDDVQSNLNLIGLNLRRVGADCAHVRLGVAGWVARSAAPSNVQRRRGRGTVLDRRLAVPRPADRSLLGRDHSRRGQFLFTDNTASGTISRYSIADNGTLTLLGSTAVSSQSGVGAVDVRLSGDGQTLYVDESRVGAVGEFAVDGGQLTELGSVPLPAGATPAGVAVK